MITAIVRFPLPPGTTRDKAKEAFSASAPNFEGLPGLARKYYIFCDDGTGGAVYVWRSREAADRFHTEAWKKQLERRYGAAPDVVFFETPVIIDNGVAGAVQIAPANE